MLVHCNEIGYYVNFTLWCMRYAIRDTKNVSWSECGAWGVAHLIETCKISIIKSNWLHKSNNGHRTMDINSRATPVQMALTRKAIGDWWQRLCQMLIIINFISNMLSLDIYQFNQSVRSSGFIDLSIVCMGYGCVSNSRIHYWLRKNENEMHSCAKHLLFIGKTNIRTHHIDNDWQQSFDVRWSWIAWKHKILFTRSNILNIELHALWKYEFVCNDFESVTHSIDIQHGLSLSHLHIQQC